MFALCAGGGAESGNTTASAGQTISHGRGQSTTSGEEPRAGGGWVDRQRGLATG